MKAETYILDGNVMLLLEAIHPNAQMSEASYSDTFRKK